MELNIEKRLKQAFEKATHHHLARKLRTPADFERLAEIESKHISAQKAEHRDWQAHKPAHIAQARAEILDALRTNRQPAPRPRWAAESAEPLGQQAERLATQAHQSRLQQIDTQAQTARQDLMAEITQRDRPNATRAFNHARDRRQGQDRRKHTQSRD